MPKEFFGKKVEVTVMEIVSTSSAKYAALPQGKRLLLMNCLKVLECLLIFYLLT